MTPNCRDCTEKRWIPVSTGYCTGCFPEIPSASELDKNHPGGLRWDIMDKCMGKTCPVCGKRRVHLYFCKVGFDALHWLVTNGFNAFNDKDTLVRRVV